MQHMQNAAHPLTLRHVTQVEKAPVVIKSAVAKADAENLKKLIEAGEFSKHNQRIVCRHGM